MELVGDLSPSIFPKTILFHPNYFPGQRFECIVTSTGEIDRTQETPFPFGDPPWETRRITQFRKHYGPCGSEPFYVFARVQEGKLKVTLNNITEYTDN